MTDQFFERPILNSPYEYPVRHWELDEFWAADAAGSMNDGGRPKFVTPIPKPRRKRSRGEQEELVFERWSGAFVDRMRSSMTLRVM